MKKKKTIATTTMTTTSTGEENTFTSVKTFKVENEPPFIKLYIDCVLVLHECKITLSPVLIELLRGMTYANDEIGQIINTTLFVKKNIAQKLNISVSRVEKIIQELNNNRILSRLSPSTYQVNPNIFGRGKWEDIYKLRETTINWAKLKPTIKTTIKYKRKD